MRLGISTASFFNRIQLESAFDMLRQMRVDTTEVFFNTFSEYEKPFVDALVSRRGNIAVHSVHALSTQFEPQLFSANLRVRADAETIFRKVCYAGFMLGAKFYTFHGISKIKNESTAPDYGRLADRINQIVEIAAGYQIKLSYENVHWTLASHPDFFKQILQRCPGLYTTLDIKQAAQAGCDVTKFMDVMGSRISTIHLCDINKGETALPGDGKVNWEKFFRELVKREINVNMFMEVYSRDYKDYNDLRSSYDFLCQALSKSKK